MSRGPVFLERHSYRRRRVLEGVRMLPVLGLLLFLMPLIWSAAPGRTLGTAASGMYLFAVWAGLILGSFLFARYQRRRGDPGDTSGPGAGPEA